MLAVLTHDDKLIRWSIAISLERELQEGAGAFAGPGDPQLQLPQAPCALRWLGVCFLQTSTSQVPFHWYLISASQIEKSENTTGKHHLLLQC